MSSGWRPAYLPGPDNEVHVIPLEDVIKHEIDEHCVCGPDFDTVEGENDYYGWVYTHHALDGREHDEPDHDRESCPVCSSRV